jgi:hypothetical protein
MTHGSGDWGWEGETQAATWPMSPGRKRSDCKRSMALVRLLLGPRYGGRLFLLNCPSAGVCSDMAVGLHAMRTTVGWVWLVAPVAVAPRHEVTGASLCRVGRAWTGQRATIDRSLVARLSRQPGLAFSMPLS